MSFTELPREIRDQIYGLCFLVDGHVAPYPESNAHVRSRDYKGMDFGILQQLPEFGHTDLSLTGDKISSHIALLRVSQSISSEAAAVLYGVRIIRIFFLPHLQMSHHTGHASSAQTASNPQSVSYILLIPR